MNSRRIRLQLRVLIVTAMTFFSLVIVMPNDAAAACFAPGAANRLATRGPSGVAGLREKAVLARGLAVSLEASSSSGPVVGLWRTVFTANPGTQDEFKFDEGFQQFHADGTELMVSRGVPPDLGNVCIGVWERTAGGLVKLRHVTWNWGGQSDFGGSDPFTDAFSNANTGYFELIVTLRVNEQGTGFSGNWEAVSFDVDEMPIAGSEFSGTVEGERLRASRP